MIDPICLRKPPPAGRNGGRMMVGGYYVRNSSDCPFPAEPLHSHV